MLKRISPVIEDFLIGFQRNPEAVGEETELWKSLYTAFFQHFTHLGLVYQLDKSQLDIHYYPEENQVKLNPVRTAYPTKEKFDIAILDLDAKTEQAKSERFQGYWQQPLAAAFNIHLCGDEDLAIKYYRKLDKDLKKMKGFLDQQAGNSSFCGLTLLLVNGNVGEEVGASIDWELKSGIQAWVVADNGTFLYQS